MKQRNKMLFLAGSTGMVGTSILTNILKDRARIRIRASYLHTRPFIRDKRIEYVKGDLRSLSDCRRMVRGCDRAIMAAAVTSGAAGLVAKPVEQVSDNILMNTQMLEAFYRENVKRAVYIGSSTVYQEYKGSIREDQLDLNKPPHPGYAGIGNVVRFIEKLCEFWHVQTGIEIVILRATNIFGPYARFDPQSSNFIPAIIRKAVARMDPFEVWGSPRVVRDVIYSEDFARGVVAALGKENIRFDIFNIGSGLQTEVSGVVRLALQCAGHIPGRITYNGSRPTTSSFRAFDCSKAGRLLGWKPACTLEEGIRITADWWIKNRGWWKR
jgi:nucleoside-diphosphate-sugar epimerase